MYNFIMVDTIEKKVYCCVWIFSDQLTRILWRGLRSYDVRPRNGESIWRAGPMWENTWTAHKSMKAALQLVCRWTRLLEIRNGTSARLLCSGEIATVGKETDERRPMRRRRALTDIASLWRFLYGHWYFPVSGRKGFVESGVAMNIPFLKASILC